MKIAISGASGFVGTHLWAYLQRQGHSIVPLGRDDLADGAQTHLGELLDGCDAVINLAGAPIDRRWSRTYKETLFASRVDTTRRLVEAVNSCASIQTFISTSAVGYYPSVGCYDEDTDEPGTGFLAHLCALWEDEARKVGVRCVITRFGVVLSPDGGAFPRLMRPIRSGLAVIPGSGAQPFAWVALEDLLRAEEYLLTRPELSGVFNFTAPDSITMRELVQGAAVRCHARLRVRIPSWMIRLAMGESAAVLLDGQCAEPKRLLQSGFEFSVPTIRDFLEHC